MKDTTANNLNQSDPVRKVESCLSSCGVFYFFPLITAEARAVSLLNANTTNAESVSVSVLNNSFNPVVGSVSRQLALHKHIQNERCNEHKPNHGSLINRSIQYK
jgi:hypothetical protein